MKQEELIKQELYRLCGQSIEERINNLKQRLESIEESRDNETKSSVGDKYETGRAMMQMEAEKINVQLFEASQVKAALLKIDPKKRPEKIGPGSLVMTTKGTYYLAIGLGKVTLEGRLYYCISGDSPIGRKMNGGKAGDEIEFNGTTMLIEEVR